jgi:hypothetical protein
MSDFVFDYQDFINNFTEFLSFTEAQVNSQLNKTRLIYAGLFYAEDGNLDHEALRKECVYLALAHFLTLEANPQLAIGGKLKSIRNRQDAVTFAVNDSDTIYSLTNTMYGQLLDQKIEAMSRGGLVMWGQDIGILDGECLDVAFS